MLDRAKFLVVSEISEVMGEKVPLIDVRVDQSLEQCFSTQARNEARSKAAKATRASKATAAPAAPPAPAARPARAARAS